MNTVNTVVINDVFVPSKFAETGNLGFSLEGEDLNFYMPASMVHSMVKNMIGNKPLTYSHLFLLSGMSLTYKQRAVYQPGMNNNWKGEEFEVKGDKPILDFRSPSIKVALADKPALLQTLAALPESETIFNPETAVAKEADPVVQLED